MIIVDQALKERHEIKQPIRVGLVGAGMMGRSLVNQIVNFVPGMALVAASNRTPARVDEAFKRAGVDEIRSVSGVKDLEDAVTAGVAANVEDPMLLCESENIDALIDATGAIEFGAALALKAIEHGKHSVSMNVELVATVGAALNERAKKAGVIYTLSDGDQPGVQMNLWRFVKSIGLEPLVCGNIKGLQDEYRNPTTQIEFAKKWGQKPIMVSSFADGSKISMEQACVANAAGMQVEMRGMRGGDFEGHVDDLCHCGRYDVDKLRALGGVVDYVVKAKPPPGVFVLATLEDPEQRRLLDLYKLGKGPLYCFYTPYHLCHFEAPLSVARVVLFKDAILQTEQHRVDVISVAKRELKAGETIDPIGGYMTYGQCENYPVVSSKRLLLHGLAEGCMLKRDVRKDAALTYDDVALPAGRVSDQLRAEQNALFPAP